MIKVALVGKPNVGKSTLFNRIISKKKAIVDNMPGVTRDRIYGNALWTNKSFTIIDTGGLTNKNITLQENIEQQVKLAIEEANIIIFLVSAKEEINNDDYYVSRILKKHKTKNVLLVVNKSENIIDKNDRSFYSLSFGKPIFISSEHGIGVGDLLDEIIKRFPKQLNDKKENVSFPFCIIGRTNVGKSTLTNAILNEERMVVSPTPHTTRDSVDTDFKYHNNAYTIIDTAGIRRKGKITDNIEKYAVLRTEQAIKRSKLIILILDGSEPFNQQDEIIGGLAHQANIPTIICVNKWDSLIKDNATMNLKIKEIRSRFRYLSYAPIIFISALKKQRLGTIFEAINKIQEQIKIQVSSSLLNDVIAKAQITNPPPLYKGERANLTSASQVASQIPTFVIFGNDPKHIHLSYARYIENQIRESFGITIVPITIYFKDKNARTRGIRERR